MRSKDKLPSVVHHRAVEDMAGDHMEQRCFYNKDLDMGKLPVPSIPKKKNKDKSQYVKVPSSYLGGNKYRITIFSTVVGELSFFKISLKKIKSHDMEK